MNPIVRFLKAVFNFIVGDWILLIGTTLSFGLVFWLVQAGAVSVSNLAPVVFVAGLLIVLCLSLARETRQKP